MLQACVTTNPDGACAAAYYSVGPQTFSCSSCSDCAQAVQSAAQACGGNVLDGGGADGDAGGSSPLSGFFGRWLCNQTTTLTFTMPSDAPQQTTRVASTVTVAATGTGSGFVATSDDDGGPPCPVKFTANGAVATLDPGQSCATATAMSSTKQTFTGGSAAMSLNMLSFFEQFTFTGRTPFGSIAGSASWRRAMSAWPSASASRRPS